ncbi:MAG: TCP-1/cpn60 chaperonin family protein [Patescibacteria group bacterium]
MAGKSKVMKTGDEARSKIMQGVDLYADAIKMTLGPWGQNAIMGIRGGDPEITNDGKKIGDNISSKDELVDLGIRAIRGGVKKTNEEIGDMSSTTTTLIQSITKAVIKMMPKGDVVAGKKSIMQIHKQLDDECIDVIGKLEAMAENITTEEELVGVVRASVEDENLAEMIGKMQWKIGSEGSIIPEEVNDAETTIERINGIRIDNGFGTSSIVNNLEKQSLEINDVRIILTNSTFQNLQPVLKLLEQIVKLRNKDGSTARVAILGRGFSENAIKACMKNHENGFQVFPINAPYLNQNQMLKDMAAVLGGTFFNVEERDLEDMQMSDVGFAEKISASRWSAIFTGTADQEAAARICGRAEDLKKEMEGESSLFEKKHIQARIAQLENGFAIIKVGGLTEQNRKYKRDKIEDAVSTARLALQEGVVPGAGLALKAVADELPETSVLKKALKVPYEQIMANAGEDFTVEPWVKDSFKSLRISIRNAIETAKDLSTAAIAINHENELTQFVAKTPQPESEGVQ